MIFRQKCILFLIITKPIIKDIKFNKKKKKKKGKLVRSQSINLFMKKQQTLHFYFLMFLFDSIVGFIRFITIIVTFSFNVLSYPHC